MKPAWAKKLVNYLIFYPRFSQFILVSTKKFDFVPSWMAFTITYILFFVIIIVEIKLYAMCYATLW